MNHIIEDLTVGALRKALAAMPADAPVCVIYDSGFAVRDSAVVELDNGTVYIDIDADAVYFAKKAAT